jgi:hypothetical protein
VVQKVTLVQGDSTQVSLDISGCGFDHTATWSVDDATVIDMKTTTNSNPRAARVKGLRVGMATVTVKLVGYEGFPAKVAVEVRAP